MGPKGQGKRASRTTRRMPEPSARRREGQATRPPAGPPSIPQEGTLRPTSSCITAHRERFSMGSPVVGGRLPRPPSSAGPSATQEEVQARRPSSASTQSPGAVEGGDPQTPSRGVPCTAVEVKQPRASSSTRSADRSSSAEVLEREALPRPPPRAASTAPEEEGAAGRISSNTNRSEPPRALDPQAAQGRVARRPSSRPRPTIDQGPGVPWVSPPMTQMMQLPAIPQKGEPLSPPPTGATSKLEEVNQTISLTLINRGLPTGHGGEDSTTPKLQAARPNLAANDRRERRVTGRAFTTLSPLKLGTGVIGQAPRAKAEALQVQLPRIPSRSESVHAGHPEGSARAAGHSAGGRSERDDKGDRAAMKTSTSAQGSVHARAIHGQLVKQIAALAKLAADKAKQRREDLVKAEATCDFTVVGVSPSNTQRETGKAQGLPQLDCVPHLQQRRQDLATAPDTPHLGVGQVHPTVLLEATGNPQDLPQLDFTRHQSPAGCHLSGLFTFTKLCPSSDERVCAGDGHSSVPPPSPDSAIECVLLQPEMLPKPEPSVRAKAVMALRKSGQHMRKMPVHHVDKEMLFVRGENKGMGGLSNKIIEEEKCDEEEGRELKKQVPAPTKPKQSVAQEHQPLTARKVQFQEASPPLSLRAKLSREWQASQARRSVDLAKTAREWKAHSHFIRQKSFLERQIPKLDIVKTGNSKARELALQMQPSDRSTKAHINLCLSTEMEDQRLRDQLDKLTKQYEKLQITKKEFLRRKEHLEKKWNSLILSSGIPH